MNLFKKALVASAIAGVCATAQAADLTDAVTAHSIQGLEVNGASDSSVRAIVREQLEAGDLVTLVFGAGVDTTGLTTDVDGTPTAGALNIIYGSGTYTFKVHASTDLSKNTLVLEVETGDPVTKDSSFEVSVPAAAYDVTKTAQSTVTYSAVSGLTGDAKDTTGDNVGLLITTQNQYSAVVKSDLDGIVERKNAVTFIKNGEDATGASSTTKDTLVVTITDNQTLLSAVNFNTVTGTFDLTIDGNFKDFAPGDVVTASTGDDTCAAETFPTTKQMAVTCTAGADASINSFSVEYTKQAAANSVLPATTFTADLDVDFGGAKDLTVLANADAGEWELDATIINVPYFPVGFEGTSSAIHLSNESGSVVDVIVSAISTVDADGDAVVYAAKDLGMDLPATSVTKISQGKLMELLEVPAGSKLSVTFNIDADDGDVRAYAFTTDDTGRTEISNSAQHGK